MRKFHLLFISIFLLIQIGCSHYPALQEPDFEMFNQTVHSVSLQDSLSNGKLTSGMPYFVVNQLFKNYSEGMMEVKIPVADRKSVV